jgi:hypothetical protein
MFVRGIQILLILLTAVASPAEETHSFYFGGGGESEDLQETMFLDELKVFYSVVEQKKWPITALHDGGHSSDDEWVRKNHENTVKNFSKNEFERSLKDTEKKVQGGNIKSGEQILIFISSHGSAKSNSEKTHQISTNDGQVKLDRLKKLRDLAEKKGVKLAIVDTSCYGGASLNLATNKTCVLSMSGDDYAYAGDSTRFLKALKTENNLESAFLSARTSNGIYTATAQPQISSEAGELSKNKLNFLKQDIHDPNDTMILSSQDKNCKLLSPTNISDFEKILAELNKGNIVGNQNEEQEMKKKLLEYRLLEKQLFEIKSKVTHLNTATCKNLKRDMEICLTMSQIDANIEFFSAEIKNGNDPTGEVAEMLDATLKIHDSPEFKKYQSQLEEGKVLAKQMYRGTIRVSEMERKLYGKMYSEYSKNSRKANPCRDFKI